MRRSCFRFVSVALILLSWSSLSLAEGRLASYKRVVRETGTQFHFKGGLKVNGREGDWACSVKMPSDKDVIQLSPKGVIIECWLFSNEKARDAFLSATDAFRKASIEGIKFLGQNMPRVKISSGKIHGLKVMESDCPGCTHCTRGVFTGNFPRVRSMWVDSASLVRCSVTTMGGADPRPYMARLIENLRKSGLIASNVSGSGLGNGGSQPAGNQSGVAITFQHPDRLPVPGKGVIKIVAKDGRGVAVRKGRVQIEWVTPDFITKSPVTGKLNGDGVLVVPVTTRVPPDLGVLLPEPASLRVKLKITVTPEGDRPAVSGILDIPLNLCLIVGTTVGPDMEPRSESQAPGLLRMSPTLFVKNWRDDTGKFRVLVRPFHPQSGRTPKEWWLTWSDKDRLPLEFPLDKTPRPGKIIDVGAVDILTPDEHVSRLRKVAAEFLAAMPLTPSEQSGVQRALRAIVFQDGGVSDVPYFTDNFTNDSGVIHMPGVSKEYWSRNLHVEDDAAYEIIPHELGHFVHHHLVERFRYINMCYNKLSTGVHSTWTTEAGQSPVKLPYISFSENTADFFALLFRNFWIARHPEIKESVYFKRPGYLGEFETDAKAMKVIASLKPGYRVEGVQTRFLRVFYANAAKTRPARVFSDYLNTMLLYMDRPQGWLGGLVNRPARTIYQWVEGKRRMPGAFGPSDPVALATRYRLIPGAPPTPTATITYGSKTGGLKIGRKTVDFSKFPVAPVPFGRRIDVTSGMISIDLSGMDTRRTLTVKAPAILVMESRTEVRVLKGMVGADFPVTLITPGGKVKPRGTVVRVYVDEKGMTRVDTVEGTARVVSNGGTVKLLHRGQSVHMDAGGELTSVSTCKPEAILRGLLPNVALPPVPAGAKRPSSPKTPAVTTAQNIGGNGSRTGQGAFPVTLSCTHNDNLEKGCCCMKGAHTYLFAPRHVVDVLARFDTGRNLNCRSVVTLEINRGGRWITVKTVQAVSSRGNNENAPVNVLVPVNATIRGFRISDRCACCIDFSEIVLNAGGAGGISPPPNPSRSANGGTANPWVVNQSGQVFQWTGQKWLRVSGHARDIGTGGDGSAWIIGAVKAKGGFGIFKWQGGKWERVPGGAERIDVGPDGRPWVVNTRGQIFQWTGTEWMIMPGRARDIGIGSDGTAWIIGAVKAKGGFGIFKWQGGKWERVPGGAERIDVGPDGRPWVVNSSELIFQWLGNGWRIMPGRARDIGIGSDGSVWVIGTSKTKGGYGIYHWRNGLWKRVPGGAVAISVNSVGVVHPVPVNVDPTVGDDATETGSGSGEAR